MKKIFFIIVSFISTKAFSQTQAIYAGIGFSGNYFNEKSENNISKRFPYTYSIFKETSDITFSTKDGKKLNEVLRKSVEKNYEGSFLIETTPSKLPSLQEGNTIALALIFDTENIFTSKAMSSSLTVYRTDILIGAQVLFFDFSTKRIICAYPSYLKYVFIQKDIPPTEKEIKSIIHKMYFGGLKTSDGKEISVPNRFVEVLNKAHPNRSYGKTISIGNIHLSSEFSENLPLLHHPAKTNSLEENKLKEEFIASIFNAYLYQNCNVSTLPYTEDKKNYYCFMRNSFNDAYESYNFQVPESNYAINLTMKDLKAQGQKEKLGTRIYSFSASYDIEITESSKKIFAAHMTEANADVFSIGKEKDWSFDDRLFSVFMKLMHTSTERISKYPNAYKIFESCR